MGYEDDHELSVGEDVKQDDRELRGIQCTLNNWQEGLGKFTNINSNLGNK
jgi:hypothetical protein